MRNEANGLTIHERDITSEVCQRCAACCRVKVNLPNASRRYRIFLRQAGVSVSPPAKPGEADCCDKEHAIDIDLGDCQHLETATAEDGSKRYRCAIHDDASLPQLCAHYNCVSWAKANDLYSDANPMLLSAQLALGDLAGSP